MTDWRTLTAEQFDHLARTQPPGTTVSRGIFDRLPFAFDAKDQFLTWRDSLAYSFDIDGRDICLIGSAATGRSLNKEKRFKAFDDGSDLDIAIISAHHFDIAWSWFRRRSQTALIAPDPTTRELIREHREHYIFDGVIAAEYFLTHFGAFGEQWLRGLQAAQVNLPLRLQGRKGSLRIYRDYSALRLQQTEAVTEFQTFLSTGSDGKKELNR